MSGAPITVTAKELTATLDRRKLLHGVSFTLRPGKTTAIVGPPRSGKSLLLQTMAGRARVTGGSLLVKGIVPYRSRELTQDVCLIRSVGSFFGALSVRRTFDLYRANRPYWDEETAERLLHNFSLSLRALPENLSKADLHKMSLVLALASRCPLTLLDEVLVGIDEKDRSIVTREIRREQQACPRTLVLSSSFAFEIDEFADDIMLLHKGQIVDFRSAAKIAGGITMITGPIEMVSQFCVGQECSHIQDEGGNRVASLPTSLDAADRARASRVGVRIVESSLLDKLACLNDPGANGEVERQ